MLIQLGKSDHLTMEWLYNCYAQTGRTRVEKFLYNKADYENIRTSLVAWTVRKVRE